MNDFLEQVAAIYYGFPDEPISQKLSEWYNWLYSQLEEYRGFLVCPPPEPPASAEQALLMLDEFTTEETLEAITGYLTSRLIQEGRLQGVRALRALFRQVYRGILIGN